MGAHPRPDLPALSAPVAVPLIDVMAPPKINPGDLVFKILYDLNIKELASAGEIYGIIMDPFKPKFIMQDRVRQAMATADHCAFCCLGNPPGPCAPDNHLFEVISEPDPGGPVSKRLRDLSSKETKAIGRAHGLSTDSRERTTVMKWRIAQKMSNVGRCATWNLHHRTGPCNPNTHTFIIHPEPLLPVATSPSLMTYASVVTRNAHADSLPPKTNICRITSPSSGQLCRNIAPSLPSASDQHGSDTSTPALPQQPTVQATPRIKYIHELSKAELIIAGGRFGIDLSMAHPADALRSRLASTMASQSYCVTCRNIPRSRQCNVHAHPFTFPAGGPAPPPTTSSPPVVPTPTSPALPTAGPTQVTEPAPTPAVKFLCDLSVHELVAAGERFGADVGMTDPPADLRRKLALAMAARPVCEACPGTPLGLCSILRHPFAVSDFTSSSRAAPAWRLRDLQQQDLVIISAILGRTRCSRLTRQPGLCGIAT